jgi:hypothetical protein
MLHLDTSFDNDLNTLPNLNWLPWIGENYINTRVILIGESHYDDDEGWLQEKNATRNFVNNQGLNSRNPDFKNRNFFHQIEKTLLNEDKSTVDQREKLWKNVAFFNLVQNLMPSADDRPTEKDYDIGWNNFMEIINILKPKICIKFGYEGNGRLGSLLHIGETGWTRDNLQEFFTKPFCFNLTKSDNKMRIIFTHHPTGSFGYDYKIWSEHIKNNFTEVDSLFD